MKTSFAAVLVAVLAGCATQSGEQSSSASSSQPAPAPAPSARSAPATSIASVRASEKMAPQTRSVYYEFDKADIKPEAVKVIEANAQYLRDHQTKIRVEGNADERGSREYNLALGQRRADAVMKRMTLLGIPGDRIETVSYGKEKPKATGHDESAWSENRRSDIVYR